MPLSVIARSRFARRALIVLSLMALVCTPVAPVSADAEMYVVSGTLTTTLGQPKLDLEINLYELSESGEQGDLIQTVNPFGTGNARFEFSAVEGGRSYRVKTADHAGSFESEAYDFELNGDQHLDVAIATKKRFHATIEASGEPAAGAVVRLLRWDGEKEIDDLGLESTVGEDGNWFSPPVRDGLYKAKLMLDGTPWVMPVPYLFTGTGPTKSFILDSSASRVQISARIEPMYTAGSIKGRVVDSRGNGIDGVRVDAIAVGGDSGSEMKSAESDETGYWEVPSLISGYYKVKYSNAGRKLDEYHGGVSSQAESRSMTVLAKSVRDLGEVVLEDPGVVAGRVSSRVAGALKGVTVRAFPINKGIRSEVADGEATVNSDGRYAIQGLRGATSYRLRFVDPSGRLKAAWSPVVEVQENHERTLSTVTLVAVPKKSASVQVSARSAKKKATFTVTVKASGVTPTGKVTVKLGTKSLKTVKLKNGKATIKVTRQKKGSRTYRIVYSGDERVATKSVARKVKIK